ncbi:hypothetical protein Tco_0394815 [Tanacetum coccineum]
MSARDKTGLGYSTQLNELSSNHETDSENSLSIFDVRSSDEENTPKNDRFSKNMYKAVPPPIIGNFLTPRADISFAGLDEYAIRNKIIESQTTELIITKTKSYYTKPAFRPKDLKQDVKIFGVQNITTAGTRAVVNTSKGKLDIDFKKSRWVWRPKGNYLDHVSKDSGSFMLKKVEYVTGSLHSGRLWLSSHMMQQSLSFDMKISMGGRFMALESDPIPKEICVDDEKEGLHISQPILDPQKSKVHHVEYANWAACSSICQIILNHDGNRGL